MPTTRYYLTGNTQLTTAFPALPVWERGSGGAGERLMELQTTPTPAATAWNYIMGENAGGANTTNSLRGDSWATPPLTPGAYSGHARLALWVGALPYWVDGAWEFGVRLIAADLSHKAHLVIPNNGQSSWRQTGLAFSGETVLLDGDLPEFTAADGDRLVVELGGRTGWEDYRGISWSVGYDTATPLAAVDRSTAYGHQWLDLTLAPVVVPDPPGPPTALAVIDLAPTSATVTWGPPETGGPFTGYELRLDGGVATPATSPHPLAELTPATAYAVEVRATGGPGGPGPWASVAATTLPAPPSAPFRTVVRIGPHTWTASAGDPPELGPVLPVGFGWAVPEDSLGFPAQPDADTCPLELVTATHEDMAGVDIGTTMRVSLYADSDPRPLATFRGRVADLESAPHRLGLSWRLLGVGYVATDLGTNVGAGEWPQESGDARAGRIMAEAGKPGFTADPIGNTVEGRQPAPAPARELLLGLSNAAVSNVGTAYGPSRRVLIHPVTDDDGELVAANPFRGTEVVARVDAIDTLDAGLVNRATTWRRTKLLDATWVRIDHPGGPTVYGDTRGPAYPPVSVSVLDTDELADLILDTSPGYRWLTGQPMRLELWADDGPAMAVVRQWFYRDSASHPFPWSGRAVIVNRIAQAPDGSTRYAGMLAAATIRLEHVPGIGGRLVVEFRLRPEIPSDSTVTMRWMDEPAGATWADELADDPTGTWYDYYTTPRP